MIYVQCKQAVDGTYMKTTENHSAEHRPPRRVHQTAFSQVAATPAASRVTSAPTPPVTCSADHKDVIRCLETRGPEHPELSRS